MSSQISGGHLMDLRAWARWGIGVEHAKDNIRVTPAMALKNMTQAFWKLASVMCTVNHRNLPSQRAGWLASPMMEIMPLPRIMMRMASPMASVRIRGTLKWVE